MVLHHPPRPEKAMVINVHNGEGNSNSVAEGCGSGGTCSTGTCGNGLEKVYPTAAVRYGYMKTVGEFAYPSAEMKFGCGASVIIQTNRGIEMGEMVSLSCNGCDKCVSREQIRNYVEASGPDYYHFDNGRILRLATEEDRADWEHIRAETLRKKTFCQERADEYRLPLKVLECEHLFGGERIIFFFMSEGRIDFRALVKELADEFQTRIEMRQVGARDEARLLADYETCGRECCCKNFLKSLKPISMKMAKMQKATLDPAKVSGRCGRLKCCLRYEHTTYEELNGALPPLGKKVFTESGVGTVAARQILTQLLQIQTDDGGRFTIPLEAILDEAEYIRQEEAKAEAAKLEAARRAGMKKASDEAAASERTSNHRGGRRRSTRGRSPRKTEAGGSGARDGGETARPGKAGGQEDGPPGNAERRAGGIEPDQSGAEAPAGRQRGQGEGARRRHRRGRRPFRGPNGEKRNGEGGPPSAAG